jgi:arginyl-tRNA synthetase
MAQHEIRVELERVAALLGAASGAVIELETPKEKGHGDLSTNLAMQLAKPLRAAPRAIAERIVKPLQFAPGLVDAVEVSLFGGRPVGEAAFADCRARFDRFAALQSGAVS